jgi:hypothetical protein
MQASVDNARRHIDRLRVALASPSPRDIEEVLPEMELAVASMKELEQELARGGVATASLALDLIALSREISVVERLTDHGLEQCQGWAALLATAAGGYVASGEPAPLKPDLP